MKKFENPIMTISKFEVEDVVTASGTGTDVPEKKDAKVAAQEYFEQNTSISEILVF